MVLPEVVDDDDELVDVLVAVVLLLVLVVVLVRVVLSRLPDELLSNIHFNIVSFIFSRMSEFPNSMVVCGYTNKTL